MGDAMIKYKSQQGLTLLEALVSTAIVGIGFVAIFSMVNFSVQSIDSSAERTKANYLVSMIAEDIIGHRNTIHGVNMETENIDFNAEGKPITVNDTGTEVSSLSKFSEHLVDNNFEIDNAGNVCADKSNYAKKDDIENLYISGDEYSDASQNKNKKWTDILGSDRYLKCKGPSDTKTVKIFEICKWDHCDYMHSDVYDDGLFIGRVQINMNNGAKRRFLYFQADYQLRN